MQWRNPVPVSQELCWLCKLCQRRKKKKIIFLSFDLVLLVWAAVQINQYPNSFQENELQTHLFHRKWSEQYFRVQNSKINKIICFHWFSAFWKRQNPFGWDFYRKYATFSQSVSQCAKCAFIASLCLFTKHDSFESLSKYTINFYRFSVESSIQVRPDLFSWQNTRGEKKSW